VTWWRKTVAFPGPARSTGRGRHTVRAGACRSPCSSPLTFERGENRRRRDAHAKAVCHRCPVITDCRHHALAVAEPYGVWARLSAEEREEDLLATQRRAESMPVPVRSDHRQDTDTP